MSSLLLLSLKSLSQVFYCRVLFVLIVITIEILIFVVMLIFKLYCFFIGVGCVGSEGMVLSPMS